MLQPPKQILRAVARNTRTFPLQTWRQLVHDAFARLVGDSLAASAPALCDRVAKQQEIKLAAVERQLYVIGHRMPFTALGPSGGRSEFIARHRVHAFVLVS